MVSRRMEATAPQDRLGMSEFQEQTMKYQFEANDEVFVLDTKELKWGHASNVAYDMKEQRVLVCMGAGAYFLDGSERAGLSTVHLLCVPFDDSIVMYLVPNVKVEEDSFTMNLPQEMQRFIKYAVRNPDETGTP
jgi:hypothetical protein